MKHLNKIVFINSANIPYAEVMLDGNVHFAGTQGVGKSTVLRALLFFYNADKMRLGIQPGQKSFEEFYFKHSNSYIVYEVKTGESAYSILLTRRGGRVAYRFIDAPYRKEWIVAEDGRAESDWIKVRAAIGEGVDISRTVDTYEEYRDIIFGATADRSHRYDKYALVVSKKYENIPRSIQNVFLNSKLDADFVKTTIIQSMDETEQAINLANYRRWVNEFEREFDEIDCWFRKEANGEVKVRVEADHVISTYRVLVSLDGELLSAWHRLNYALDKAHEQQPVLEASIDSLRESLRDKQQRIEGTRHEYEKEHDQLTRKIGEQEVRLSDIRRKRKHYEQIGIDRIIHQVEQEPKLRGRQAQSQQLLHTLSQQFDDVTAKYRALYAAYETEWAAFLAGQADERNRKKDELLGQKERLLLAREARGKSTREAYDEWMGQSDLRLRTLNEECRRAETRLADIQHYHPLAAQIEACQDDMEQLRRQEQQWKSQQAIAQGEIKRLQDMAQMVCQQIEQDHARQDKQLRAEADALQAELERIESLLERWQGSLYEWLAEHKPGWEQTIGRVVDEQRVLYAQGLEPELAAGDDVVLGVRLKLDAIPAHHHTPDEYRQQAKRLREDVAQKQQELAKLPALLKQALDAARRPYTAKLANLKQEEATLHLQLRQAPQKLRDAETKLRLLRQQEDKLVADERERREANAAKARLELERETEERKQAAIRRDRELQAAEREWKKAVSEAHKAYDKHCATLQAETEERKQQFDAREQATRHQERNELKGKGADTEAIERCREEIKSLQRELDEIEKQKHLVIEYRKDEDELFAREGEYRDTKRKLEASDAQLRKSFDDKLKRLRNEREQLQAQLKQKEDELATIKKGEADFQLLCQQERTALAPLLADDQQKSTPDTAVALVERARTCLASRRQKTDELKRAVNTFNTHFGPGNTFHFAQPQMDEEYAAFAANLYDFVENNKIEDYRQRVSQHYNRILRSVAREVGLIMNSSAEIRHIVTELNHDFQKRSFAGVIKSIELRAEESSDRMMRLLCTIRDFTDEHALTIGEANLFSTADRDDVNRRVVELLRDFMKQLQREPARTELTLSDTFRLQFRVQENDNSTGWVERINNVGSDGTDILVKAMVNIMLINVFKTKAARRSGDFVVHCMMDEIGKLHPGNVQGILQFANVRNIYLINSSPMSYNADIYRHNYLLTKDSQSQTHVTRLLTTPS